MLCLLDLRDHIDSRLMAPALVLRVQPLFHDHLCGLDADDSGTESNDIGVVMLFGKTCGIRIAADAGTDPVNLVGGQADAHAGTADQHTCIHFPGGNHLCHFVSADRIIESFRIICTYVDNLQPFLFEEGGDLILHFNGNMIVSYSYTHFFLLIYLLRTVICSLFIVLFSKCSAFCLAYFNVYIFLM